MIRISEDVTDLLFRLLFCSIFVGLGGEHVFADGLIRQLMPTWVPMPRVVSLTCGVWLVGWGSLIALGWKVRWAAQALGIFVVLVTLLVHAPGVMSYPATINQECGWMWDILQRSNLVKNVCLLGVCFHLLHHEVGKFSLEHYFAKKGYPRKH